MGTSISLKRFMFRLKQFDLGREISRQSYIISILQLRDHLLQSLHFVLLQLIVQHDLLELMLDKRRNMTRLTEGFQLLLVVLVFSFDALNLEFQHVVRCDYPIVHYPFKIVVFLAQFRTGVKITISLVV